jgi:hypothetical protein
VSCARAKAEGGRPPCVGASYVGVTRVSVFYHNDMRNIAVGICNVVATPEYLAPMVIQTFMISI